jgi:hypothetical protein
MKGINKMNDKKQNHFISPDVNKLQAIVIDHNTIIYVAIDADPEEAKKRYLSRNIRPRF